MRPARSSGASFGRPPPTLERITSALLLLLATRPCGAGAPPPGLPLQLAVTDLRAVSSKPFTVDVTATLDGSSDTPEVSGSLDVAFRDNAPGSEYSRIVLGSGGSQLACAPSPNAAAAGSGGGGGGGARRCSFSVTGLLPDRRYQFRLAPAAPASGAISPAFSASFSADEWRQLAAVESAWVAVQGAAAPSAARLVLGSLAVRHAADTSLCLTAQLSGLPASRGDAQRVLQGIEFVAEVMAAVGAEGWAADDHLGGHGASPSPDASVGAEAWARVAVAAPAAVQLVAPGDDGSALSTTTDDTASVAHVQLTVTGLPPGTALWLRLAAQRQTTFVAAATTPAHTAADGELGQADRAAVGLEEEDGAAARPPLPALSSFYATTVFSHALALTTEPAPPPPPRLMPLIRRRIGVHEVVVRIQGSSRDWGSADNPRSPLPPPPPQPPPTHALLGYAVQLQALTSPTSDRPSIATTERSPGGAVPPDLDSSTVTPPEGAAWLTLVAGASRTALLACLASPDNETQVLQIRCGANRTAVAPSAHAFEVVGRFGETRDSGLYAELSLAAQSPTRDACGAYEYAVRITGLTPSTLYTLRVRTYSQRRAGGDETRSRVPAVDTRDVVVGPWSPPSPRFRTRALPRSLVGAPLTPAAREGTLPPLSAGAVDGSDVPLPAPPRVTAVNSVSVRLGWSAVLWPPVTDAPSTARGPADEDRSDESPELGGRIAVGAPSAAYGLELATGPSDDAFEEVWRGVGVAAQLAGLQPSTPYRVRLVAIRDDGTHSASSAPQSFVTSAPAYNTWRQVALVAAAGSLVGPIPEQLVPPPLAGASLTVVGRAAYLVGGLSTGYSCALGALTAACRAATGLRSESWRLDLGTLAWAPLETDGERPPPRSHHVAAALHGDVYIWSGFADAAAASAAGASNATDSAPTLLHKDMWRLDVGASPRDTRVTTHAGSIANQTFPAELPKELSMWLPLDVLEDATPSAPVVGVASSVAPGTCVASLEVTVELSASTRLASLVMSLEGPAAATPVTLLPGRTAAPAGGGRLEVPLQPARVPPRAGWLYDSSGGGGGGVVVQAPPAPPSSFSQPPWSPSAQVAKTMSLVFRSAVGLAVLASCDADGGFVDTWRGCGAHQRSSRGDSEATTAPSLDAFIGAPAAGRWCLRATDTQAGESATAAVVAWGLRLLSEPCEPRATWQAVTASGVALVAAAAGGAAAADGGQSAQTPSTFAALPPPRAAASSIAIGPNTLFVSSGVGQRWPGGAAAMGAATPAVDASSSPLGALTGSAHDVWRFDAAASEWTQLLAPAYAAVNSTAVPLDAAVATSALGASLATAAGAPLFMVLAFGGALPPAPEAQGAAAAVAGCSRYRSKGRFDAVSRVGRPDGVPAYPVRADESYACEDAATQTRFWDAAFGGRWRRLHPSLEPAAAAGCLQSPWCRVPHPRRHAALAVVPPRAVFSAGTGAGGATDGTGASDVPLEPPPPVRVLLFGGQSTASPGATAGDVDGGGGTVLGDFWSLPLAEAMAAADVSGAQYSSPTLEQLAAGDVAPARAAAAAARCRGGWWQWAIQPCLTANATDAWRARRACSWGLLLEAAALAGAC